MTENGRFRRFRNLLSIPILCLFPCAAQASPDFHAELSSPQVVDGSILLVTVKIAGEKSAEGKLTENLNKTPFQATAKFEDTEVPLFPLSEKGEGIYQGVLGIPFNHKPGSATVTIKAGDGPEAKTEELSFNIVDGNYPSETLKVDERRVNPKKTDMKRIRREIKEVHKIYAVITPKKFWNGPFLLPIQSEVTSVFGTKRVLNGEMQTFHRGLDLKAKSGTPIHAAAPGKVVLAKNLFFTGNTVLLDHGYGIYTLYAHMSRIKVKLGQVVTDHKLLGLSGKTGRVSGPHLHWGAIVQRTQVNPMDLTRVIQ
jgi:murein DD-endopeptidase MepM/ murein hydrolase activator NlpD